MRAKRTTRNKGLRVGVTLFIREESQSLWENGIFQNCFFLLMLLERSPLVASSFIVNGGPCKAANAPRILSHAPAPVLEMDEAMNELDVVIELSAQLNPGWGRQFRERGGRIISMHVANDYVIDMERMVFGLAPGMLMSGTPYDAIWTLPAFAATCQSYYGAMGGAPVTPMQHLWSPVLLEAARADRGDERPFAYEPGRMRWRLAVMEPNICSVKTCHLPMLAADCAHRMWPTFIECLRVFNAMKIKEHPDFIAFARSLDLVTQGIASFEPRLHLLDVMHGQADAVISHHWHNAQNYLYYELLHGGYPLIHNSGMIGDCGYRYDDFDPESGAEALIEAFMVHDASLPGYRAKAQRLLAELDPVSERNVASYGAAISAVMEATP